jgi:hypothetical protein
MLIPSPYENYPPNWDIFNYFARIASPSYFNLFSSTGDINRFAARYRLAKCFRGMSLESFSESTANGYSALCRVLLVWSAFEYFLKAINIRQTDLADLLSSYNTKQWIDEIRMADVDEKFYRFIYERANQTHQGELDNYFENDPCNITYMAWNCSMNFLETTSLPKICSAMTTAPTILQSHGRACAARWDDSSSRL